MIQKRTRRKKLHEHGTEAARWMRWWRMRVKNRAKKEEDEKTSGKSGGGRCSGLDAVAPKG
jgi:hypothetical protein